MSSLALTKSYADSTLLFSSDLHDMWIELEAKTNGLLASDNVAAGWASFSNVTFAKDTDYTLGTTASAYIGLTTATNNLYFENVSAATSFLFQQAGTTIAFLNTSGDLVVDKDIFFYNRSTVYPLSYLIGYAKPVLVYTDATSISVEQNTTTANRTLIVFPAGPIAVAEDITTTNKFRQLKIDVSANGYLVGHTGAADSGMKVGLSLTENTWYFVYAVVVQGGTDSSNNNFIMVVDSVNPSPANWGTLDTSYGSGMWVYLGLFRYGYGLTSGAVIVPFLNDKSGWHTFTGRAATNNFFGIKVAEGSITSTTYATVETFTPANSGDAVPASCSHFKMTMRPVASGAEMNGTMIITDGSDNVLWDLQSFAVNLAIDEAHGMSAIVPNITSIKLKAKTGI